MAKLTGGGCFHIHSLMETSFFAGYITKGFSPQSGEGGASHYYNRVPLQYKLILETEFFMLVVYIKATNLQYHSPHIVFEVYIHRVGNMPHNILLIFLNMVSYRFFGIIHKPMKKVQSHYKLIL